MSSQDQSTFLDRHGLLILVCTLKSMFLKGIAIEINLLILLRKYLSDIIINFVVLQLIYPSNIMIYVNIEINISFIKLWQH